MPLQILQVIYSLKILAPARIASFGADAVTPWPPSGQGTVGSTPTRSTRLATGDQRARTTRSAERLTRALDTTE
jgi:hypothetical protein